MALKALSQNKLTGALVRVMGFAQRYTAAVDFEELQVARFIQAEFEHVRVRESMEETSVRARLQIPLRLRCPRSPAHQDIKKHLIMFDVVRVESCDSHPHLAELLL